MTSAIPQLQFTDWPAGQQAAWDALFVEGDILDGKGPACHWSEATRKTNRKHYAQWLGWLRLDGQHLDVAEPWRQATPDSVTAYGRALRVGRSPRTVASALIGLKCVLIRIAPEVDWRWLRDLTNRLDAWAKPSRKPVAAPLPAPEMFATVVAQLKGLSEAPSSSVRYRLTFRDMLMVALLIACPIRLRNLAMMKTDVHLVQVGDDWHPRFEPEETKTGAPVHYVIPQALTAPIRHYLDHVRSRFCGSDKTDRVWSGAKKAPLAENTIYQNIVRRTEILFGTAINPHTFRSIAATFLADSSPSDALRARPLLGHRNGATTEEYYINACQIEASRKVANALNAIRDEK